tara:strand:- start:50 stop:274 length:225 start_codon:yes stop_codon:yes gene_type:complete
LYVVHHENTLLHILEKVKGVSGKSYSQTVDNFLENKLDTNWGTPASLAKLFTMACAGTGLALVERLGVPEGDYA